jgi:hypothetical protein
MFAVAAGGARGLVLVAQQVGGTQKLRNTEAGTAPDQTRRQQLLQGENPRDTLAPIEMHSYPGTVDLPVST